MLDLVVPTGATAVDVAREYAKQVEVAGAVPGIPLLQTALGERLNASVPLGEAGVQPGDVLVATSGVHRPRQDDAARRGQERSREPGARLDDRDGRGGAAVLAAWYAARAGEETVRTVAVGILLACALVGVLPVGRHTRQRAAAAPAFAAAAAFAALYEPGVHLLPAILGAAGISAAVVAGIGRALAVRTDETSTVWIASGLSSSRAAPSRRCWAGTPGSRGPSWSSCR